MTGPGTMQTFQAELLEDPAIPVRARAALKEGLETGVLEATARREDVAALERYVTPTHPAELVNTHTHTHTCMCV